MGAVLVSSSYRLFKSYCSTLILLEVILGTIPIHIHSGAALLCNVLEIVK